VKKVPATTSGEPAKLPKFGGWRPALEILAITVVFAAAGCWPVPDSNEAVYLTKARHAADPSFAQGDFFLESPDAHGVFYLVMGPLAAGLTLDQAAWVGRLFGWLAVAIGFRHAVVPLLPGGENGRGGGWQRLVAAVVFSLALRHTTAAGEWVLGGCEAKVFAWALVLGGLGEWLRDRFAWAWLLLGAATALHPIVGGWAIVATTVARLFTPPLLKPVSNLGLAAALVITGCLLVATGVWPALTLNTGADLVTKSEAARIYVSERLPHHLLPRAFAPGLIARHVLAIIAWWLLSRAEPATPTRGRLITFTLAALGISLVGVMISTAEPWAPAMAHRLLRYYWFRLGDMAVPLAHAATVAAVLGNDAAIRRILPVSPRLVRGLVAALLLVDFAAQSAHWPLPGRGIPARSDQRVIAPAWADICDWVREHAEPGDCVLTPQGAGNFTWRTGLPEVVCWKNSPQDAASLVAWRQRFIDCYSRDGSLQNRLPSTADLGADRLRLVADRYGATLAIVPLTTPGLDELPFARLHSNSHYAVLRLQEPVRAESKEATRRLEGGKSRVAGEDTP
jgi:hypothetical protein